MLQAERALSAPARPRRAAELQSRERDALGRGPGGPPGVREERRPPLKGARVVIHEKTDARWRPYMGRRPQVPDPRVPAVSRQAQKLQHHSVAICEEPAGRWAGTWTAPQGEEGATPSEGGPARQCACHQVALDQPRGFAQDLGRSPLREARTPQTAIKGGRQRPPHKGLVVEGQLYLRHFRRPRHLGQCPCPSDQVPDKILRPPPAQRGPWPKVWLVADRIPREGADKIVPGKKAAGPWSRLVWEQGLKTHIKRV